MISFCSKCTLLTLWWWQDHKDNQIYSINNTVRPSFPDRPPIILSNTKVVPEFWHMYVFTLHKRCFRITNHPCSCNLRLSEALHLGLAPSGPHILLNSCVCVCVYMLACACACLHVCVHACMCASMWYVCVYVCTYCTYELISSESFWTIEITLDFIYVHAIITVM